jgi:predicted nucleic acid-binding Zn ribbon protein
MMARTQPAQIKSIIQNAIQKVRAQKQATARVKRAWQTAVGKEAARHSRPIKLSRKTLVVSVDSSAWIYYLHNRKQQIEAAINKHLDAQHTIKIMLRAGDDSEQKNKASTSKKQKNKSCAKKTT